MRSPRKVTFAPKGWLARSLKFEMAFFERLMAGLWPLIIVNSSTAMSKSLMLFSEAAFPTQTLMTIFCTFGTSITFLISNFFINEGIISLEYFSFSMVFVAILFFLIHYFPALFASTGFLSASQNLMGDADQDVRPRADRRPAGDVN